MKKGKLIYSVLFFAVCLCPSVGMLIAKPETSSENRQLSEFPTLKTEEGKWNVEWLSQAGDYFQEHFAFRNELVTGNALLHGKLLETRGKTDGFIIKILWMIIWGRICFQTEVCIILHICCP